MGEFKRDYCGERYGRLVVIGDVPREEWKANNRREVICQCDCGKTIKCRPSNLLSGNTKSCGCYESELTRKRVRNPIVGKRFGRLVVLSEDDLHGSNNNNRMAVCQCYCGNIVSKRISDIKNGSTKSCGCLKSDLIRKNQMEDISGQKFGELTAVCPIVGDKRIKWLFRCSCGREFEALPINVKRGMTKSCGHIGKSKAEYDIFKYLSDKGIQFSYNVCPFDDFRNSNTGYKMYIDFCIVKPNGEHIFIEHQGIQHYYADSRNSHFGYEQRKTDKIKMEYCKSKGIKLYETRYDEDYISHLSSILKENGL